MISCKRCGLGEAYKAGFVRGYQRYKCKSCAYNYTITPPRGRPQHEKLLALSLYASGLSINKIAQYFKVSPPGVLRWIKKTRSGIMRQARTRFLKDYDGAGRDVALS